MIAAHRIILFAYGDDINAIAWLELEVPVILGHTCDDMVMGEPPVTANTTILYPQVGVGC